MTDTVTIAHTYADNGWRVIPIPAGRKFPEGITRWQDKATTDHDTIDAWWNEHPDHGIGIATGPGSGIWVLDIDDYDSYRDLEQRHEPLPDTLTVITGSGGYHFYYRHPDGIDIRNNASTRLGPGLDVRGDGGFVVAPPSVHPNGRTYEWDAGQPDEIAEAPQWLIDLVCEQPHKPAASTLTNVNDGDRPGDLYAAQVDWQTILEADGWQLHHVDRNGERYWTRPGKDRREGASATTGWSAADNLKVFTSSMRHAGLEPEESYTKLGYIAATRHHGDHSAAARTLAEYGFSTPRDDVEVLNGPAASVVNEPVADDLGGWEFVDLDPIIDGTFDPPTPTMAVRSDGIGLIYPGRVHSIVGEPGGGKTWLALHMIVETIQAGGSGALIDYEDTASACVHRLTLLGLTHNEIRSNFTYVRPDGPLVTKSGKVATRTIEQLAGLGADLVVIDSVGESLAVEGLPPNDDDAVTQWFRRLPRMLARTGAAVVGLDHVTKSKDDRGLWAIGSQRKLAAIDGAAYGVNVKVAPTKTKDGKLTVTCAKDRHGAHQAGQLVANVAIDNVAEGVRVTLSAPEGKFRPTHYMEQVSRFLEEIPCASQRGIVDSVVGRASHIRTAIECLVEEGYVKCDVTKRGNQYQLITTFRDEDEVETLTASTASHRVPEDRDAVQTNPESDRVHRVPDPLRSRGLAGTRSEASGDTQTHPSDRDRVPASEPVETPTADDTPTTHLDIDVDEFIANF